MPKLIVPLIAATVLMAGAAAAQNPNASQGQDFANCAGAIAAFTGLDLAQHYPNMRQQPPSDGWSPTLSAVLRGLSRQPGLEGMTGFEAARASRLHWAEQPRAQQQAQAEACRAHVEGN